MVTAETASIGSFFLRKIVLFGITLFPGLVLVFFTGTGFGEDADAWRIVLSGYDISHSGIWLPSRFPGAPLPELIAAFFTLPFLAEGSIVTLPIFHVFLYACGLFIILLPNYTGNKWVTSREIFIILLFWLLPVIAVNSTTTMDYAPAFFSFILSRHFLLNRKFTGSALWFGVCLLCRLQYLMLIPALMIYALSREKTITIRNMVRYLFIVTAIFFIGYGYFVLTYGTELFLFPKPPYPTIAEIIGRGTVKVFGIAASFALPLYLFFRIRNISTGVFFARYSGDLAGVGGSLFFYLLYPYEAGYLIPVAVLLLIIFSDLCTDTAMKYAVFIGTISAFAGDFVNKSFVVPGPIITQSFRRNYNYSEIKMAADYLSKETRNLRIICGAELPKILVLLRLNNSKISNNLQLVYGTPEEMVAKVPEGYEVISLQAYTLQARAK